MAVIAMVIGNINNAITFFILERSTSVRWSSHNKVN